MLQQEFTIRCNDAEIFYRDYGDGPALLLLHGFFTTGAVWDPYLPLLSSQYRLIIPDLRGHGLSTNPGHQISHRQIALDIYALLDQCKIRSFSAAGFSSGGMALLHMATQQPERIKGLALFGAANYFPEQCRAICRSVRMPEDESDAWLMELRSFHLQGDNQIRELIEQFQQFALSYDDMNFTTPYLSTITARTLIVHGDRDEYFPVSIPVEMYHAIPNAALSIVPFARHDLSQLWPKPLIGTTNRPDPVVAFLATGDW